jgi:broad specificity phosphatase PhoE
MRLLITRHGETEGNVKRILAGVNDPLTKNGIAQAEKLARRLKQVNIAAIYTSPISRAKRTALIIAKYHPKAALHVTKSLEEMHLGSYEEKGFDDVDWKNMPATVESRKSLYARTKKLLAIVMKKHARETVLFVGHNAVNKALLRVLRNLDPDDPSSIPQSNTNLTICTLGKNGCKELLFNCTKHLQ